MMIITRLLLVVVLGLTMIQTTIKHGQGKKDMFFFI